MPTCMRRWSQRGPSILRSILFRGGVSMFRRRPDAAPATIAVIVEGRTALVPSGASAAAAVLVAGFRHIRETPVEGRERGPYCMMGVCFARRNRRRAEPAELHGRGASGHAHPPSDPGAENRSSTTMTVELAIIGAGPACMAAAVLAAELGVETALIDEQAS